MMDVTPKTRILLIDSDDGFRTQLGRYLAERGFCVADGADTTAIERHLDAGRFELVVLDMGLPGQDSIALARRIRARSDRPLIMVSALADETDRAIGLELGADDYIVKPPSYRELLARIRAVLRRYRGSTTLTDESAESACIRFGPFALDTFCRTLVRAGQEIPLTPAEFSLLAAFARHPHRALTRDTLVELTKGYDRNPLDRSVDMLVARLRRKIETNPTNPKYIRTVWGTGYIFTPAPSPTGYASRSFVLSAKGSGR